MIGRLFTFLVDVETCYYLAEFIYICFQGSSFYKTQIGFDLSFHHRDEMSEQVYLKRLRENGGKSFAQKVKRSVEKIRNHGVPFIEYGLKAVQMLGREISSERKSVNVWAADSKALNKGDNSQPLARTLR